MAAEGKINNYDLVGKKGGRGTTRKGKKRLFQQKICNRPQNFSFCVGSSLKISRVASRIMNFEL